MFRVLSEEEAAKVEVWRAPELDSGGGSGSAQIAAKARSVDASSQHLKLVRSTEAGLIESAQPDQRQAAASVAQQYGSQQSEAGQTAAQQSTPAPAASDQDKLTQTDAPQTGSGQLESGAAQAEVAARIDPNIDLMQNAYDEGYAAGQRDVQQATAQLDAAEAEAAAQELAAIANILRSLSSQQKKMDELVEHELIELAAAMARLILQRELAEDATVLSGIVKTALAQLPAACMPPRIHLNPQDAALLQPLLGEPEASSIVEDAQLNRGACEVYAGPTLLEAGIDQMVSAIASHWSVQNDAADSGDTAAPAPEPGVADRKL